MMTSLLLGISMIVVVVGILMMNQTSSYDTQIMDRGPLPFYLPFFYIMHSPFAVAGIGSFAIVLVVCLLLLGAIRFFILPKFYDQVAMAVPDHGSVRRKQKSGQGLSQMLFSYNSQLVRDPNLIMQVLSTSLMTPIILL